MLICMHILRLEIPLGIRVAATGDPVPEAARSTLGDVIPRKLELGEVHSYSWLLHEKRNCSSTDSSELSRVADYSPMHPLLLTNCPV